MKHFLKGLGAMALIAIIIVVVLGVFGVFDEETEQSSIAVELGIQETHSNLIGSIQYRTFVTNSLDTAKLESFALSNSNNNILTGDYFLFYLPKSSPIWLNKFTSKNEIDQAIYQSCADLIILVSNNNTMICECDWFKPNDNE